MSIDKEKALTITCKGLISLIFLAPQPGLEPGTYGLTVGVLNVAVGGVDIDFLTCGFLIKSYLPALFVAIENPANYLYIDHDLAPDHDGVWCCGFAPAGFDVALGCCFGCVAAKVLNFLDGFAS
jgi:hypothetical protein